MKKLVVLLILLSLVILTDLIKITGAHSQESGILLLANRAENNPNQVSFNVAFGVEQYENSEKSDILWEQWQLTCQGPFDRSCSLERTCFWNTGEFGTTIAIKEHKSNDGSLKITDMDWKKGILNFTLIHKGLLDNPGNKTDVSIKMEWRDNVLYLTGFKGLSTRRGLMDPSELNTIEFRIPEYSYFKQAPIEMPGFKSSK